MIINPQAARKLADFIENPHKQWEFDMSVVLDNNELGNWKDPIMYSPVCGTAGCIAGAAILCWPEKLKKFNSITNIYYIAASLLGMNYKDACDLFDANPNGRIWPQFNDEVQLSDISEEDAVKELRRLADVSSSN